VDSQNALSVLKIYISRYLLYLHCLTSASSLTILSVLCCLSLLLYRAYCRPFADGEA